MAGRNLERGLVLIGFRVDRKRTTLSLDDLLFAYLARKLGSPAAARQWLAREAELLYAAGDAGELVSGVSRLVQRRALHFLLEDVYPADGSDGLADAPGAAAGLPVEDPDGSVEGGADGGAAPVSVSESGQFVPNPDSPAV